MEEEISCSVYKTENKADTKVRITDKLVELNTEGEDKEIIEIGDIIAVEDVNPENTDETNKSVALHYINKSTSPVWIKAKVEYHGNKEQCDKFSNTVQSRLNEEVVRCRPKKLYVIICPVSGMKQGEQIFRDTVEPLFKLASVETEVVVSQYHKHVEEITAATDFSTFDGIVVCGGDGTYHEVLNILIKKTQENSGIDYNDPKAQLQPLQTPVGFIPTGSGNSLAVIAHGCNDAVTSTLHIIQGRHHSLGVSVVFSGGKWIGNACLIVAFGWWAEMFYYMENFRWLKTNRYKYVPVYFCLMKKKHIFNAEIELTLKDTCIQKETESDQELQNTNTENTEKISDEFCEITLFNGDFFTEDYKTGIKPIDYFSSVLALYMPFDRRELLDLHVKMISGRETNQFQKDFVMKRRITGLKVKTSPISNRNTFINRIADVPTRVFLDGELVELPTEEWEVRCLDKLVPVFSSLEELGTLKM